MYGETFYGRHTAQHQLPGFKKTYQTNQRPLAEYFLDTPLNLNSTNG